MQSPAAAAQLAISQTVVVFSTAVAKDAEATEIKDRNEALENIEEENSRRAVRAPECEKKNAWARRVHFRQSKQQQPTRSRTHVLLLPPTTRCRQLPARRAIIVASCRPHRAQHTL